MEKRGRSEIFTFSSRARKKGAIELSIGTIVIIVLAMSMLILGLVLVKNIFSGATAVTDMTNAQLKDQVSRMFGEDSRLVAYPDTEHINVKGGELGEFGFGVKNLLEGSQAGTSFNYEVVVSDDDIQKNCGVSEREAEDWITVGRSERLEIPTGEIETGRVRIEIPDGAKLCTFRYRVNVYGADNTIYDSVRMDVTIRA